MSANTTTLYRHTKREKWGLAILAADLGERRSYQFADGKLRTFKEGFYGMLEVVTDPPEEAQLLIRELNQALDRSQARKDVVRTNTKGRTTVLTLDDQIALFRFEYKGGFQDEIWESKVRGAEAPRRLKCHREAAIKKAQELLDEGILSVLVADGKAEEVREAVLAVFTSTDLVRPADDLKPLRELPESEWQAFAEAVLDLLYGTAAYDERFDAFLKVFDTDLTWPFSTTLSALVHPDQHSHVRPSSIRRQAQWLRPRLTVVNKPGGALYLAILDMAREVLGGLNQVELQPRDMVDVYDFIRTTLRPKARQLLDGFRRSGGVTGEPDKLAAEQEAAEVEAVSAAASGESAAGESAAAADADAEAPKQ